MSRIISLLILAAIVLVAGFLFYQVISNYFVPVFAAIVLTLVFRPVHNWFLNQCRGRDRIAAGLTTAAILLIVLVPLTGILFRAVSDARGWVSTSGEIRFDLEWLHNLVADIITRFQLPIAADDVIQNVFEMTKDFAALIPSLLANFVFGFFVMVLSLYYFLADGPAMVSSVSNVLPLKSGYQSVLLAEFETVSRAIVSATLLSAVAQGLLAAIGYYFSGIESVFLLMLLTMLMSMVPFIGSLSVWGTAAVWLYFTGRTTEGLLLALYGAAIVSTADNIIKPLVLGGQSRLHPLWALLSVLGGLRAMGPIGIFVGPLVLAFLQAGLKMMTQELTMLDSRAKKEVAKS